MSLADFSDEERDLRALLFRLRYGRGGADPGFHKRELVCTPCGGEYSGVGSWMIAVNGSPPKGCLVILAPSYLHRSIFLDSYGSRVKRLGPKDDFIVKRFAARFCPFGRLDDYKPFTLKGAL